MKTYEAVFILDDKKLDDHGDSFARQVGDHIRDLGGKVKEKGSLGRKQFARRIKKRSAGQYWDFVFDLDPDKVVTFEDKYRLDDAVLRLVVFIYEPPPPGVERVTGRRDRDRGGGGDGGSGGGGGGGYGRRRR